MMKLIEFILTTAAVFLTCAGAYAQAASNPPYSIEQSVIAGGGGTSADTGSSRFSVTGVIGQSIAETSSAPPLTVRSGFVTAAPLAPTAAAATIGGRVLTANGRGVRNVRITLTDAGGNSRTAISTLFGYYRFTDVAAGETYIITAQSKRFTFSQPSQVVNIVEDTDDINFTAYYP